MRNIVPVIVFILLQIAVAAVLTLWVIWSATDKSHVIWLLQGIILMVSVSSGATIIFIFYNKMRALDKERVNFISTVSHELLTPLSSIRLYTETMLIRDLDQAKRKEFLELMEGDCERLSVLISDIMTASRIERRKTRYRFERINLATVVQQYLDNNQRLLQDAHIVCSFDDQCYSLIDTDLFDTVLKNILQNAVRYSEGAAYIAINLTKVQQKVMLTVSDKGQGIERAEQKRVFKLFYRVSNKIGGTGLGLFIVKNVIKDHKGKVWLESDGPGKGTTVKILLPLAG